jgi:hypothetical protein
MPPLGCKCGSSSARGPLDWSVPGRGKRARGIGTISLVALAHATLKSCLGFRLVIHSTVQPRGERQ